MSFRAIPKELQKMARDELNENFEKTPDAIEHIREWLSKQPHLNHVQIRDQWILSYLRGCKFSYEHTKKKLELSYIVRANFPEFYSNRDPLSSEVQEVLRVGMNLQLSHPQDSTIPRVVLIRSEKNDPLVHPLTLILKVCLMIMEVKLLDDDSFVISGQNLILDMTSISLNHIVQLTPTFLKAVVTCLLHSYPVRAKGIYFINCPKIFKNLYPVLKALLPEKIRNRVSFLEEVEGLSEEIIKAMPREYGGEALSCEELTGLLKTKIEKYRDYFLGEEKYFSNESARPRKLSFEEDLFGLEGSFKKIDID